MPSAEWDEDDDPDNPPPSKPRGLDVNLFFGLSEPRPDEFYASKAMRWSQAARDQQVYHEAMADVAQEASGFARIKGEPLGQIG